MAGRVIPAKGFDRFVRIISLAADSVESDVHGIALGDGPALGQVRDLAANIGAGATFHFPGYQADLVNHSPPVKSGLRDAALPR